MSTVLRRLPSFVTAALCSLSGLAVVLIAPRSSANEFYVDPVAGSTSGDGSQAHPWRRLQDLVDQHLIRLRRCDSQPCSNPSDFHVDNPQAPVGPGDTIWLRSGDHGSVVLSNVHNDSPIIVRAASGSSPTLRRVHLVAASGWVFEGVSVTPGSINACRDQFGESLMYFGASSTKGPSSRITVRACLVSSWSDISQWSDAVWNQRACSGIFMDGPDMLVEKNRVENIYQGIQMLGPRSKVLGNTVVNFSGDGLRGLGDDSVFEDNVVKNAYCVNYPKDHDDGFQTWSPGSRRKSR